MNMIHILPPEEATKIAAGEVIDRPAALVREFMDNAIDAGAELVEVSIEGGGITRTEVSDDGHGMSCEDLELCCLTHATSKIRSLSDLDTSKSLGFRGEALAAAAAVSCVEILTGTENHDNNSRLKAWKLLSLPGKAIQIEAASRTRGTSIRAMGLFDSIPARKRFLKREGSEAVLCRNVFYDKAMAFPDIGFRFFQDGKLKAFLPPHASFKERFVKIALNESQTAKQVSSADQFVYEISAKGHGYEVIMVFGGPELSRQDRRQQYIFANGRRIQDYSLVQALEFGLRGLFPNGTHPIGAIFVNIDPALADFNIHPAKKEVRFLDSGAIHHSITSSLENFRQRIFTHVSDDSNYEYDKSIKEQTELLQEQTNFDQKPAAFSAKAFTAQDSSAITAQISSASSLNAAQAPVSYNGLRLIGRVFDLFILVEYNEKLIIIDQHAAHERILYNSLIDKPIPDQELLVPIPFQTDSKEDDLFLETRQKELAGLGIKIEKDELHSKGAWRIDALPSGWDLSADDTVKKILSLKTADKNLADKWLISLSCTKAVKDGDYLDDESAIALAEKALNLNDLHCPHGRPILFEISLKEMLKAVKRT